MGTVFECNEWLPDLPDFGNQGIVKAENVLPARQGYLPWPAPFAVSDSLTATPIGAGAGTSIDEDSHVYAGTATTLEGMLGGVWSDQSKVGGYTNTATRWDFATYGPVMIATNGVDNPQFIDMDAVGGKFADVTTLFQARTVATVRDFVMFGNTTDATDGHVADRIRWSAVGDYTDYVISATTQSDFQDNPGGGSCQRVFGGEEAIIFFERAIYKATYVGSPVVFQFDEVVTNRGLYVPDAAAKIDDMVFFLDSDGFYVFQGNRANPIGDEKVNRWFFANLDGANQDKISCAIDHERRVVMWAFPSTTSSAKPDKIIAYNWTTGRWSYGKVDCDIIFTTLSSTFTLEELDALAGSLDDMNISLDSRLLNAAGTINVGIMNNNRLNGFGGDPLDGVIEFDERQTVQGQRALMTEVWPLVDGGTSTVEIGTRNRQQDAVNWSSAYSVNSIGYAPVREEGRYHRIRLNVTGTFSDIQGVDTKVAGCGVR